MFRAGRRFQAIGDLLDRLAVASEEVQVNSRELTLLAQLLLDRHGELRELFDAATAELRPAAAVPIMGVKLGKECEA